MAVGEGSLVVTAKGTDFIAGSVGHVGVFDGKVIHNALVHPEETASVGGAGRQVAHRAAVTVELTEEGMSSGTDRTFPGLGLEIRIEIVRQLEEGVRTTRIDFNTGEEVLRFRTAEGFRILICSGSVIIESVARVHILGELGQFSMVLDNTGEFLANAHGDIQMLGIVTLGCGQYITACRFGAEGSAGIAKSCFLAGPYNTIGGGRGKGIGGISRNGICRLVICQIYWRRSYI